MNNDVKGSNFDKKNENSEIFVPSKESARRSTRRQSAPCSSNNATDLQLGNDKTSKKTDRGLSTLTTKRLYCDSAKKDSLIHASREKICPEKQRTKKCDKVALEVVRRPRNRPSTRQERKVSRTLVSDRKRDNSVSHKQRSTLNDGKKISSNGTDANLPKEFSHKTIRSKDSPKEKEICCKDIQSAAKSMVDRVPRNENEAMTVDRGRQVSRIKKYSVHVKKKDEIELYQKKNENGTDEGSKKNGENKQFSTVQTIDDDKSAHGKTVCNNRENGENNGAARTRIFYLKKRPEIGSNYKEKVESSKSKLGDGKLSSEKQNGRRHEIEMNKSTKKIRKQDSVNYASGTVGELCQKSLSTLKFHSDYHEFQESGKNDIRSIERGVNNNSTLDADNGTNDEIALPTNTDVDLSRAKATMKKKKELITDPTGAAYRDRIEMTKSQTVSEVSSVLQDEITYQTNLVNYRYNSDQQYCKGRDEKYAADAFLKSVQMNKNKNMSDDDDAKYNLMKALINPATKIHNFKETDSNVNKLSDSFQKLESISISRNEGLENHHRNSSSNSSVDTVTPSPSNDVQQSQNDTKISKSIDSLNPHASLTRFRQSPIISTSNDDMTNSKMRGCKYTKKYRHFKYEEKNKCSSMARYIKRIISNERRYRKNSEKKLNPEKEEVEIVIDDESPKTSRIRIVNDRSSVSVVCRGSRRIVSPNEQKNNVAANKAESSGGESSGYKSLHISKTKHIDHSNQIEVKSAIEQENQRFDKSTSDYGHGVHFPPYNPLTRYETSEPFIGKADDSIPLSSSNHIHKGDLEIRQNACDKKRGKRSTDIKFTPSDTNTYLSRFTNCMNVHLPSEITAYQLNKVNGNKVLQFNDDELLEKDLDDAELQIGKYLTSEQSDSEDESLEEEESSEQLGSVQGNSTIVDEIIVLKASDNLRYKSSEMVIEQRFLNLNNAGTRTDSTDIPAAPAQLKIITSSEGMKSVQLTSESSPVSTDVSDEKLKSTNDISMTKLNSSNDSSATNHGSTPFQSTAEAVSKDFYTKPASRGISCLKRFKNKCERLDDANTVHELWANKKSTANSTDNESQTSAKSRSRKSDANKFKFNIFRRSSSSLSEKTIKVSPHQLPKPQFSFLESHVPSQSTVLSSTADTESFESDIAFKPSVDISSTLAEKPRTEFRTDNLGVHNNKKTDTNESSNEKNYTTQIQAYIPTPVSYEDIRAQPGTSAAPPLNKNLFEETQKLHAAVPPPASAVPPPYPFCCPMAPYMMQHWQNYQQPPPASTVPLPEANWKSNAGVSNSMPPPPGMVPTPWFPQIPQMNNTLPTGRVNSANNLYAQPPHEWLMMPRSYAPCLPCSKIPELHLKKTDSLINEDTDESVFETIENKQDVKKKTVSNKLFKIFRKKTKGDGETANDDGKKAKNLRSRSESKLIQKVRVEQNDKQISDDRSIWESPDIAGIVTPEEIGRCFRRGFRADGLTLSGEDYLCTRAPSDTTIGQEDVFSFSEHDTPLDFLLALGFSVDEATAAIREDEVRRRFKAALTEARIWVPHIATTQGTLLYLLAMKAKPKVMRYFLQLVESIVNKRITNAVKLDAYLKILEKVEDGYVSFVTLFGKDTGQEDEEDTVIVEKQRRRIFYTIYKYAESEAEKVNRPLTKASVDLLHSLAARYRSAIGPHLRLLACYIGEGLLTKDVQLEAALIYLSRLDSADVRLADLELYCGLPPSERRRQEQIANEQSPEKV